MDGVVLLEVEDRGVGTSLIAEITNARIVELGVAGIRGLAKYADIPPATLHAVTKGKRVTGGYVHYKPSLKTLPNLARALGISEDEIAYLFTVVRLSGGGPLTTLVDVEKARDESLYEIHYKEDWLYEFAGMKALIPQVLYAIYYGGQDSQGRLAHPPIRELRNLSFTLNRPLSDLMRLYLDTHPTNRMFFDVGDLEREIERTYVGSTIQRMRERVPPMRRIAIKVAGRHIQSEPIKEGEEPALWLEETFIQGRNLLAFRIESDSMEGGTRPIFNGDLVIVDSGDKGHDAVPVIARLKDKRYVCKLLIDEGYGKNLVGTKSTPDDDIPFYIPSEKIEAIEGRVIEVRRSEAFSPRED